MRRYAYNSPINFIDPTGLQLVNNPIGPPLLQPSEVLSALGPDSSYTSYYRPQGSACRFIEYTRIRPQVLPGSFSYTQYYELVYESSLTEARQARASLLKKAFGALPQAGGAFRWSLRSIYTIGEICPAIDTYLIADEAWTIIRVEAERPVDVTSVVSNDPNDIVGPGGFGSNNFVSATTALYPYTIHFENDPAHATAPAQDVTITQQLSSNLDWTTFELGNFGFGSTTISVPAGLQDYQTQITYHNQDGSPLRVDFSAQLDLETGIMTWIFRSIDPATGTFPLNALAGFLPVDDSTGRGEAFVSYFVRPKAGLSTGTAINQQASIVFDLNGSVPTNVFSNTIDAGLPTSSVSALPTRESRPNFTLSWSGQDDAGGSGIASFDIFVSDNGSPFTAFLTGTTNTSATFNGTWGHSYAFYSVAVDNVGNRQTTPSTAQATTQVALEPFGLFVTALYHTVLNRAPVSGEVSPWVQFLESGNTRLRVAQFFWESPEHRAIQVQGYYQTYLGRPADSAGLGQWVAALVGGMSEIAVQEGFISSPEYQAKHSTNSSFIDGLYADVLGRTESTGEQTQWLQFLQSGNRRAQASQTFLTSSESYRRVIDGYYSNLLGRMADPGGETEWTNFVRSGSGTSDRVAEDFLSSDEYFGLAIGQ